MKRNFYLTIFMAVGLAAAPVFAADSASATNSPPGTNSMSIEALVADILQHNPELKFYSAEIAAAKGERRTAGTLPNPEASATLGHKRVSGAGDGMAWSVSLQQPFE